MEGHIVRITYHDGNGGEQIWNIYLENVFWGGKISFPMHVKKDAIDRILWMRGLSEEEFAETGEYREKGPNTGIICVYANQKRNEMYFILYTNRQQMYRHFIHFKHRRESVRFTKDSFCLKFSGCVFSDKWKDFDIQQAEVVVDQNHRYGYTTVLRKGKNYQRFCCHIPLASIVSQETDINNPIHMEVWIAIRRDADDMEHCEEEVVHLAERLSFNIGHKSKKKKPTKFYYVPIAAVYYMNKALFVRKNVHQNYTLVVREKEAIEYDQDFLQMESRSRSRWMFYVGKIRRHFQKIPVNLYYEKYSMKAEEGTFEIFEASLSSEKSKNYFILDQNSPQWEELSKHSNVVRKYSKEYYRLLYCADCFISTETSSHLNVHRAINKYVRTSLLEKKFIFLQHGVTYLKCQGSGSVFGKGKEGEPTYIMVGSEKEAKAVSRMLHIPRERCVIAGLPIFDTIEHEHIDGNSDDVVTIMLTWRPSEEYLVGHFEDSSYHKKVCEIYRILEQYIDRKKIIIVPHPKVAELLKRTELGKLVWNGTVSEVLKKTKLLVTDYSSTCYNVFYQGGAVIFYQSDLEEYEKEIGHLVPRDDEYIGYRAFDLTDLEVCIGKGITDGHIDLSLLRTEDFQKRYREINQFSDGRNIDRIVEYMIDKAII